MGLAGAGPWVGMFHGPMLAASPDLELTAVWARRPEAAAETAARFGGEPVDTFQALLDRCEAVAFCVPPDVEAELAATAARAGKHLLLEKPIALDVDAAERLTAAVDDAGVVTQVVLTNRFTEPVDAFLSQISRTTVHALTASFVCASALDGSPFATPWRRRPGAAIPDLGPHTFDLLVAAGGPIRALTATGSGGVVAVTTRHEGGATGHALLSLTTPGTDGPLTCAAVTDAGLVVLDNPRRQPDAEIQAAVAAGFVHAIAAGGTELDVHRGLMLQRVLAATTASIAEGRTVELA